MKTETFKGTIESAYGNPLPKALVFQGEFTAYESYEEASAANDLPSRDEVVTFVNSKRKANARQKSMQAALDAAGIQKPTMEDPQVQIKTIIRALVASGKSESVATQIAEQAVGAKLAA